MQKVKASKIMSVTKPFFVIRALVQLAITLIMLGVGVLSLLLFRWTAESSAGLSFFFIIAVTAAVFSLLRFAKRYILYMVKAAHVAAITEFLKTGNVPVTEKGYKGVVAYGTEKIKNNFGASNIAFTADILIAGATRQIMKWLNKAQNLFKFIPGTGHIFAFINFILSTALNFIDEAILSYVFWHSDEKNGFKKCCDGLVFYAQSWKNMLKGALKVGAFVWGLRIVTFAVFAILSYTIISLFLPFGAFFIAILFAFIILHGIETVIVEPYAVCIMINDYHNAVNGQVLKADLHGTLCRVSKKFRSLFEKADETVIYSDPDPEYSTLQY